MPVHHTGFHRHFAGLDIDDRVRKVRILHIVTIDGKRLQSNVAVGNPRRMEMGKALGQGAAEFLDQDWARLKFGNVLAERGFGRLHCNEEDPTLDFESVDGANILYRDSSDF